MAKLPRWTATEAEHALLKAGFNHLCSKGSHRIYGKDEKWSWNSTVPGWEGGFGRKVLGET